MGNQQISSNQLQELREKGVLLPDEIAFISGDLIVAENVTTGGKRVIGDNTLLTESGKRLLKG